MRGLVAALLLVLAAAPLAATEVVVERDPGADFSGYKTYAWRKGNEAGQPDAQLAIVQAVERELRVRGFSKVAESQADVFVRTSAGSIGDADATGGYVYLPNYDLGVLTRDYMVNIKAFLAVDVIDGKTDKPVWRGLASDVMGIPSPAKLRRKIDKITRKMFRDFPER